jgi:hypothetical protein
MIRSLVQRLPVMIWLFCYFGADRQAELTQNTLVHKCFRLGEQWHLPQAIRNRFFRTPTSYCWNASNAVKMDSLSKSGLAKSLVARIVENFPAPATAIIAATSRIFHGKVFRFKFASRRAVSGVATLGVGARYSLSGYPRWLFRTLAKRTAWRISSA